MDRPTGRVGSYEPAVVDAVAVAYGHCLPGALEAFGITQTQNVGRITGSWAGLGAQDQDVLRDRAQAFLKELEQAGFQITPIS